MGVVLFSPELGYLEARTVYGNDRVRRFFGGETIDPQNLRNAKEAIVRRLTVEREHISTLEDFQRFVNTRANELKLTAPRPMRIGDPLTDLSELFSELVGGRARQRTLDTVSVVTTESESSPLNRLRAAFQHLAETGRARLDFPVSVPVAGVRLKVPYAFRNGIWNLVKPQRFSGNEERMIGMALKLGAEGELLGRHGEDAEGKKKLIVVSSFGPDASESAPPRVARILHEFSVRNVAENAVPEFIKEIEATAH